MVSSFFTALAIYLILINIISALIFIKDKNAATSTKNKVRRIPEKNLHLLETVGGVFSIVLLIYIIRHKNKKISYFSITYIIKFYLIILFLKTIITSRRRSENIK